MHHLSFRIVVFEKKKDTSICYNRNSRIQEKIFLKEKSTSDRHFYPYLNKIDGKVKTIEL